MSMAPLHPLPGLPLPRHSLFARLMRNGSAAASLILLSGLLLACFSAPLIGALLNIDATSIDLFNITGAPSVIHPLGTDEIGRDLLMRLLDGGQVSLTVGIAAALSATAIGTMAGLIAGYRGGITDAVLMRLADGVISLPLLPLLIVLAAIDPAKIGLPPELVQSESFSLYRIVVIIALVGWTTTARLVRGTILSLRERDFIEAARAQGLPTSRILFRHLLPNAASPILVAMTLTVGNVILFESVLSFLGLGIQPPIPSWGNMLTGAQDLISAAPMLAIWPGLLIFAAVIAFNFLGDGLQDALNPRALSRRGR